MDRETTQQTIAEFIGTFMLVFIGAGAAAQNPTNLGAIIPALAHGLTLVAIIATFGSISGAHVNPAVTFGLFVGGHIKAQKMGFYMLAQFLGGILATGALWVVLPTAGSLGQTTGATGLNGLQVGLVEAILTFFLVSVVYQAAVYGKGGAATPVIIGLSLAGFIAFGGPLTGAALNPARMLGPAIFGDPMQEIGEILVYLAAIFLGGAVAGILHSDTFKPHHVDDEAKKRTAKK